MNRSMARLADWNNVKPVVFFVSKMMMIMGCLRDFTNRTRALRNRRQFAVSGGYLDCASCLHFHSMSSVISFCCLVVFCFVFFGIPKSLSGGYFLVRVEDFSVTYFTVSIMAVFCRFVEPKFIKRFVLMALSAPFITLSVAYDFRHVL